MTACLRAKMALAAIASLTSVAAAHAGTVEVSPVTVTLQPGQTATTLSVVNHGTSRTAIQVRSFAWSQGPSSEDLTPTNELVVSPPIFQLGPEETQTVRLLLRRPPQGVESSYRLLLDELPVGSTPGVVQFALRLSLPLFALPAGQGMPNLSWHIAPGASGTELVVANHGTRHDRLSGLSVSLPGGGSVKPGGLQNLYVLAGVERRLSLSLGRAGLGGASLTVTGTDDLGRVNAPAPLQSTP
jgi:fimbrial chaperone protein